MIERVSRYYDGPLAQLRKKNSLKAYTIAVFRKFTENKKSSYIDYVWVDGDSLGRLSEIYLGNSKYWWEIMEINPEIADPFSITPGTTIRIPYVGK